MDSVLKIPINTDTESMNNLMVQYLFQLGYLGIINYEVCIILLYIVLIIFNLY